MDQIVSAIAQKLGIPEAVVRSGLTVVLNFLKQKAGGSEFGALLNMIPGASDLANAPVPDAGGGKAVASLENAGLKTEQIAPFVQTFVGEAKKIAGEDTVNKVLESVPALANLGK
jgi:hypothetical protein